MRVVVDFKIVQQITGITWITRRAYVKQEVSYMIEVEHLSKNYGATRAVQDISFRVEKGEVIGFLGPNGAGKSTTMRMLTCYISPDEGKARIAGFDITAHPFEVKKRIGYLPENNPLYLDMGVVEYLKFIASLRGIAGGRVRERIRHVVDICGLASITSKDVGELSKGFRQRLGLAQALIHDPDVLILDEPTIGLDPHQIIEIRNLIKNIGQEKTIILSSHILPEVAATCHRVLILSRGSIVGSGTPEELSALSSGGQAIVAVIRGPRDRVEAALVALEGVTEIKHLQEDGGMQRFELLSRDAEAACEKIFFAVAAGGWSLTELYRKSINLEDVFLDLTMREAS
jgi:ABC-2 type transport system ATP-binding protein